jgi:hypothetical protein
VSQTTSTANHSFATARDRHLFGPGPKRMLALDGGGVRGVITVGFLERIEQLLSQREGHDVRLGDYFDLIGGTSTGSILAGALTLGFRTQELKHFYLQLAPRVFRRSRWRLIGWTAKFDAEALRKEIQAVVRDRTLDSSDLITGMCLVTKRMDTGSPWIISNNPRAPFWKTPPNASYVGNQHYRLANLVRASTAAPIYFDPEVLEIIEGEPHGLFIDGGVSPHNNPALALFLMSTLKAYGICWPTGPDKLLIVSLGTGGFRKRLSAVDARRIRAVGLAIRALAGLIDDAEMLALTMMQWLGECPAPWQINSEIGDLSQDFPPVGPLFKFLRYDVELNADWLKNILDIKLSETELARIRQMDNVEFVSIAYEIGQRAAAQQVKLEHLDVATR